MSKIYYDLTPMAKSITWDRFCDAVKEPHIFDKEKTLAEIFARVSDRAYREHEPGYEIPSYLTKSGAPELLTFDEEDFESEVQS